MSDIMRTITDGVKARIASVAGVTYSELAYVEAVEKNSFRTSNNRYGVRALGALQVPGVTKFTTYTQSFEVVLTKGYIQSNIDDTEQVSQSYDLRAIMLDIYTDLINTKAGVPDSVLNIHGLEFTEQEYLEDDKVVIIRSTMNIQFRITL